MRFRNRRNNRIVNRWDIQQLMTINNSIYAAKKLYINRFGLVVDPRFSKKECLKYIESNWDPMNLPRKPWNLQLRSLCVNKSLVTQDLKETLGLGLGHCTTIKPPEPNPIDMQCLCRSVRIAFTEFQDSNDNYNPRLY